jgi:hypothetical protein
MRKVFYIIAIMCLNSITVLAQNKIVFQSGEEMTGKVVSILNDELIFNFKGNNLKFPTKEVNIIYFSESLNQQKLTEKTSLSGVVTYYFNKNYGDKPDVGAIITINKIENLNENALESLYNKFDAAKLKMAMLSNIDKKDPKFTEYTDELNKLGIYTQSDLDKLDMELATILIKRTSKEGVKNITVDGNGKYSIQLDPGYYEIFMTSKGRTALSTTEISGKVFVKNIQIKPNESNVLDHSFGLY